MQPLGGTAEHWDGAYAAGEQTRSWSQPYPGASLRMFDAAGVTPQDSVIDIGGGASLLANSLLERGHEDLTVLDVSAAALRIAQRRLEATENAVEWIVADLLTWTPQRVYAVWHDRAVFHFITADQDRQRYLTNLSAATKPGSVATFGCFAPDGPRFCSGLPVARYSSDDLATSLGDGWTLVATEHEEHHTPAGAVQPFTWGAFRLNQSERPSEHAA
jgi:ribosomal protein L11 methylase PrmA